MTENESIGKKVYFTELQYGDVFQPPGYPDRRYLKYDTSFFSIPDKKLHWDKDAKEYFSTYGDICVNNDIVVELVYPVDEWEIIYQEYFRKKMKEKGDE